MNAPPTLVAFDSETHLIRPDTPVPKAVCYSFATPKEPGFVLAADSGADLLERLLSLPDNTLIGHNLSYDLQVLCRQRPELLPQVFRAFREGRLADTMVREQLLAIRRGNLQFRFLEDGRAVKQEFSLSGLVKQWLDEELEKPALRTEYEKFDGIPVEQWPVEAVRYAQLDAESTLRVYLSQAADPKPNFADERRQTFAAFSLALMPSHGVHIDGKQVLELEGRLKKRHAHFQKALLRHGLLKLKNKAGELGKDLKKIRHRILDAAVLAQVSPELTPKGKARAKDEPRWDVVREAFGAIDAGLEPDLTAMATGADAVEKVVAFPYPPECKDPAKYLEELPEAEFDALVATQPAYALAPLQAYSNIEKILGVYVKPMKEAWEEDRPMGSRPNGLVMSGRTSWAASNLDGRKIGTNLQNFPRVPGVRECIRARPGYALCSVDYDALELRTLAQVVLKIVGRSRLAERFQENPDFDPHSSFAARMLGISYEEAIALKEAKDKGFKGARQKAKAATFGFPGGLGIDRFRDYARKGYGTVLTDAEARELKDIWLAEHPEMKSYFRFVSMKAERGGEIQLPITGRYRGRCGYTDGANYGFQGLAADGAKEALNDVTEACYAIEGSVLFGARPVVFIHDEIIVEVPLDRASESAAEIKRLMEAAMVRAATPDIPSRASPALSLSWIKEASDVYDAEGFLIPWEWREN